MIDSFVINKIGLQQLQNLIYLLCTYYGKDNVNDCILHIRMEQSAVCNKCNISTNGLPDMYV